MSEGIKTLFDHSKKAWQATTLDRFNTLLELRGGGKNLRELDMFGRTSLMWALRYTARDEVIARMIEAMHEECPELIKAVDFNGITTMVYAHEYNASATVIEFLKYPKTAKKFLDTYDEQKDGTGDSFNDTDVNAPVM